MKMSMLGLGSIAAIVVAWRVLTLFFVVSFLIVKILFFVVLPICFAIWFVRKVMRAEPQRDSTTV